MPSLPAGPYEVFKYLCEQSKPVTIAELAGATNQDQAKVDPAIRGLVEQGWVELHEEEYEEFQLGPAGELFSDGVFPERRVAKALVDAGGSTDISALPEAAGMDQKTVGQSLRWLKQKGWANKEGRLVVATDLAKNLDDTLGADEQLVRTLAEVKRATGSELRERGVDLDAALDLLGQRGGFLKTKKRVRRTAQATTEGKAAWKAGIDSLREVNELTPDLLKNDEWKQVRFRPYNLELESYSVIPGKSHPFQRVLQQTRRVFLEMGFSEVTSPYVESAFWDFDALFQPQDHPAREMQDTFYVSSPAWCRLPSSDLVERVRRTHVDGGDTGSKGWGIPWKVQRAERAVLRTHTTASTIRALAQDSNPPRKVFCVGRVFRRETVDYKHLPVFHQVDGIIVDEHASFAALLGTLRRFYEKMGFDKFEFRPAFFPYTEPSVEVFVWHEKRKDWVEMGGAGVFRPEVTEPQGCRVPVLAWGLGMERLAMFRYDMSDIRQTVLSDVQWIRETPQCR